MPEKLTAKITTLFVLLSLMLNAQQDNAAGAWVDSVFHSLDLEQRIAQLMVVRANDPGKDYYPQIEKYIERYNIGGVCFFRNHPHHQAATTNRWQELAKTPLLVSIDAEWGLGMRLDSVTSFPFQMTLGAIADNALIREMGNAVAADCRRIGVNMNFAPVVDINSNAANPVIGMRSFGQDRENVMQKGLAYMQGLQENGVMATAKHFPGHGDTDTDSHHTLPLVMHGKERLDSLELYPFRRLIEEGLGGIMIAHLYIPAYEREAGLASTLSPAIVDSLLRKKMGFDGLIVTDALDMKGVTRYHKPGDIELKALMAGNDILLLPADVPRAVKRIRKAIEKGELDVAVVNQRCRKVLEYKYRAGLAQFKPVPTPGLYKDLNANNALIRKLYEASATLLRNNNGLIPLQRPDTLNIAYVSIGAPADGDKLAATLGLYSRIQTYSFENGHGEKEAGELLRQIEEHNLIIIGLRNTNIFSFRNYGIRPESYALINAISERKPAILGMLACPYALDGLDTGKLPESIIMMYQDNEVTEQLCAEVIFGGAAAGGRLPVDAGSAFPLGSGLETEMLRLGFCEPGQIGIADYFIEQADSIALSGIEKGAYPGCQVLAAKDGKVFYHKAFGFHTYDKKQAVRITDLYDLASLTKIAATTLAVMELQADGRMDVDRHLSEYLPFLKGTDKKDIVIRELMAHQSRFRAWIPYYKYTVGEEACDTGIYSGQISEMFPVRVAEKMYIREDYYRGILDSIRFSPLRESNHYEYSDLGFYLLKEAIEGIMNKPFDDFVEERYYRPMGLPAMGYHPLRRFPPARIAPTENDSYFRMQLLRGDVHDQGAAMLGGVSGHAGLFSNAFDMAAIMQTMLNGGSYGGRQYFDPEVIGDFTRTQFPLNNNRRGVGFDKPMLEYHEDGPTCRSASGKSFGHSGFTGTYAWADPENGLLYVFLSNRVYPDAANGKIMEYDIRTNLHQVFYDAIKKSSSR